MRQELKSNTVIGNYVISTYIGHGGTGLIYLATGLNNQTKKVILKELYPTELKDCIVRDGNQRIIFNDFSTEIPKDQFESKFNWYIQNIKSEHEVYNKVFNARALNNNDPYFLNSSSLIEANNTIYAVYDTFEGRNFSKFTEDEKDEPDFLKRVLSLLIIASEKLEIIHTQAHILHLDITPNNIYVVEASEKLNYENAYIIDFGSAYNLNETDEIRKHRFSISDGFSAPEICCMAQGIEREIDFSADTYSLVAVLYYSIFGKYYEDYLGLDRENRYQKIYSLCENNENIAKKFMEIFDIGLNTNPTERFLSAVDLCNKLLEVRELIGGSNEDIFSILSDEFKNQIYSRLDIVENKVDCIYKDVNKVKITLYPNTIEGQLEQLFSITDTILSAQIEDYKKAHGIKHIPLTRSAFFSLFSHKKFDKLNNTRLDILFSANECKSVEFLNQRLASSFNDEINKIISCINDRYEFYFDFEIKKICLRSKNTSFTSKEPSDSEIITVFNFLYESYTNELYDNRYKYLVKNWDGDALEMHYTMSFFAQCYTNTKLFKNNNQTLISNYFDFCEELIKRNNHNEYYIEALFKIDNPFFYDNIISIVKKYFENIYETDCSIIRFTNNFISWLPKVNTINLINLYYMLIKENHCFDSRIWNIVLNSPKRSELISYASKYLFSKDVKTNSRDAIMFVKMLSRNGTSAIFSKDDLPNSFWAFLNRIAYLIINEKTVFEEISDNEEFLHSFFSLLLQLKKSHFNDIKLLFNGAFNDISIINTLNVKNAIELFNEFNSKDYLSLPIISEPSLEKQKIDINEEKINTHLSDVESTRLVCELATDLKNKIKIEKTKENHNTITLLNLINDYNKLMSFICNYVYSNKTNELDENLIHVIVSAETEYLNLDILKIRFKIIKNELDLLRNYKTLFYKNDYLKAIINNSFRQFDKTIQIPVESINCLYNDKKHISGTHGTLEILNLLFHNRLFNYQKLILLLQSEKDNTTNFTYSNWFKVFLYNIQLNEFRSVYIKEFINKCLELNNFLAFNTEFKRALINFIKVRGEYDKQKERLCEELIRQDTFECTQYAVFLTTSLTQKNLKYCQKVLKCLEDIYLSSGGRENFVNHKATLVCHLIRLYKENTQATAMIALLAAKTLCGTIKAFARGMTDKKSILDRKELIITILNHPYIQDYVSNQSKKILELIANKDLSKFNDIILIDNDNVNRTTLLEFLNKKSNIKFTHNINFTFNISDISLRGQYAPTGNVANIKEDWNKYLLKAPLKNSVFETQNIAIIQINDIYQILYGYDEFCWLRSNFLNGKIKCPVFSPKKPLFINKANLEKEFKFALNCTEARIRIKPNIEITYKLLSSLNKDLKYCIREKFATKKIEGANDERDMITKLFPENPNVQNFIKKYLDFFGGNKYYTYYIDKQPQAFWSVYNDLQKAIEYVEDA